VGRRERRGTAGASATKELGGTRQCKDKATPPLHVTKRFQIQNYHINNTYLRKFNLKT